jgi:hypothetical protein
MLWNSIEQHSFLFSLWGRDGLCGNADCVGGSLSVQWMIEE